VTLKLLWILTGAFVLQLLTGQGSAANSPLVDWLALWPIGGESFGGGFLPWQLVTYAALHSDFIHLFFNAFMVWMIGAMLETQWGSRRYVQFILACVIAAGLTHLLFALIGLIDARGPALGISGLAYGLLLAFGMMFPEQRVMLLIPPVPIKAKYLVMILAGLALLMGLASPGGIAHFAHLGGMLGAFLVMRYWRGDPPFGKRRPTLRSVR
jgi:membrane associated rhomboid family serine protease